MENHEYWIRKTARALYNAGYRAKDREAMKEKHREFAPNDLDIIVGTLAAYEEEDRRTALGRKIFTDYWDAVVEAGGELHCDGYTVSIYDEGDGSMWPRVLAINSKSYGAQLIQDGDSESRIIRSFVKARLNAGEKI